MTSLAKPGPGEGRSEGLSLVSASALICYIVVVMTDTGVLGEFEQLILLAVLRLGEQAYGVSIRREIELYAERQVSPGALYTTLERLERKGT